MDDERSLIDRLRARNEDAFTELVERYYGYLLRLANFYVSDNSVAQEVVQETWMAILKGIDKFEERSTFKTWISRIVMNVARTRGARESRTVTFSELIDAESSRAEPSVDASRFRIAGDDYPDHWSIGPRPWNADPETQLLTTEIMTVLENAIEKLPEAQRLVLSMHDVEGWTAEEICNALGISETNQRVLLHRARSKVRGILENHYSNSGEAFRDGTRANLQRTDRTDHGLPRAAVAANGAD